MAVPDSVTTWIDQLKAGDGQAVRRLWDRYFARVVRVARDRLRGIAREMADEEDVALSAFHSFCRAYMAPEQAAGKNRDVGPAADVYALGAILYELLTGRPPFQGETAMDTVLQVLSAEAVPPGRLQPKVPRDLETVCLQCLRKEPARRYPTAQALAEDLGRFLAGEPVRAGPSPCGGGPGNWRGGGRRPPACWPPWSSSPSPRLRW